jgi:acyl carrier protein
MNHTQLIIAALAETLNIKDLNSIKLNANLKDDLGLDSMSSLTFLMRLEEAVPGFIVDPDTLDSQSFATIASITQYVDSQLINNNHEAA